MIKRCLVAALATLLALTALAAISGSPARAAGGLILTADHSGVPYGTKVRVSGHVSGPLPGASVTIERYGAAGRWTAAARPRLDASGGFTTVFKANESVLLRAVGSDGAVSNVVPLSVKPVLQLPRRFQVGYQAATSVRWPVKPASYRGAVTVRNAQGSVIGTGKARRGSVRVSVLSRQMGTTAVTIQLAKTAMLSPVVRSTSMVTGFPKLTIGSRSPLVRVLLMRLRELKYHIAGLSNRYSPKVRDAVLAFQKYQRLNRTGAMNTSTWKALSQAQPVQARYRGKGTHIEVDKTRQVLLLVRNGDVLGTLHVSTGLTGNTPVGRFHIYTMGTGSLFRFMGFHGNYGIHGYVPVPSYPASHGCVREPMWAATWTYDRSRIGTPVIIYN